MNEGLGSTVVIVIIVVFIALVSAYMAYNVNYTKAFRMKNKIISTYEKYDGKCNSNCQTEIKNYATEIGYHPGGGNFCKDNPDSPTTNNNYDEFGSGYDSDVGYCYYKVIVPKSSGTGIVDSYNHRDGYYYRITTIINIRVPIIENLMQFNYVSGDTKDFQNKK